MKSSERSKTKSSSLKVRLRLAFQNQKERLSISLCLLSLFPILCGLVVSPLVKFLEINLLQIHEDGYVYPFDKEVFGMVWTILGLSLLLILRYFKVEWNYLVLSSVCAIVVAILTISLFILTGEDFQGSSTYAFYIIIYSSVLPFFLAYSVLTTLGNLFDGKVPEYDTPWGNGVEGIFSLDDALFFRQIFDVLWAICVLLLLFGLIVNELKLMQKEKAPPTIVNIARPILSYLVAALLLCPYFIIQGSLFFLHPEPPYIIHRLVLILT